MTSMESISESCDFSRWREIKKDFLEVTIFTLPLHALDVKHLVDHQLVFEI